MISIQGSAVEMPRHQADPGRPLYGIGDFVRGHTVVRALKARWPNRPVDLLVTPLCAPLVDYMPGVRAGSSRIMPRSRLAVGRQRALAPNCASGLCDRAGPARHWKSAIAPDARRYP